MLRVGLTGGLGSGKSTVAAMLRELGAHVISADELGRTLMRPGEPVFAAILNQFGPDVLQSDGELDRQVLARLAFEEGRLPELNAIVHPAVIARQAELAAELERREPTAVLVVESALVFETEYAGAEGWRARFDRLVLVVADEPLKIARYVARTSVYRSDSTDAELATEARVRLARQMKDEDKLSFVDAVVRNNGSIQELRAQVGKLWAELASQAGDAASGSPG